jgi:hypothetical protein
MRMSHTSPETGRGARDTMVFAVILIAVGVGGLLLQIVQPSTSVGGLIVIVIGLGLLGAFAFTRQYGYLIPGGIMTGLGAGLIASESLTLTSDEGTAGVIVLGLGLGFLSIWVIGALVHVAQHHWWPIIPGGILVLVGGALLIGDQAVQLLDYWGVVLVALGLVVLWRAWAQMRANP